MKKSSETVTTATICQAHNKQAVGMTPSPADLQRPPGKQRESQRWEGPKGAGGLPHTTTSRQRGPLCPNKNLCINVHSSAIHNSQEMETTQKPIHR